MRGIYYNKRASEFFEGDIRHAKVYKGDKAWAMEMVENKKDPRSRDRFFEALYWNLGKVFE